MAKKAADVSKIPSMLGTLSDWFIDIYEFFFSRGFDEETFEKLLNLYNPGSAGAISAIPSLSGIQMVIKSVAIALLLLYSFSELAEQATSRSMTFHKLARFSIMAGVTIFLIENTDKLMYLLYEFASGFTAHANSGAAGFSDDAANKLREGLNSITGTEQFGYIFRAIVPLFFAMLNKIIFYYIAISRAIEMKVRALFAPIPAAGFVSEAERGKSVRYFKKFLALALQFAVVLAINQAMYALSSSSLFGFGPLDGYELKKKTLIDNDYSGEAAKMFMDVMLGKEGYFKRLVFALTKMALTLRSLSFINEVLGV